MANPLIHPLFTRRYSNGLSITAIWAPNPKHRGYGYDGELELVALRGDESLGSERHQLRAESLALREERTTSLTNSFAQRARDLAMA